ncbi:MAG: hypothetical protein ACREBJ_11420 [Nitrosotalea sp.]
MKQDRENEIQKWLTALNEICQYQRGSILSPETIFEDLQVACKYQRSQLDTFDLLDMFQVISENRKKNFA